MRAASTALKIKLRAEQSALASAEVEVTTGQYSDLGLQLGDQSGAELALRNQTEALQTLTAASAEMHATDMQPADADGSVWEWLKFHSQAGLNSIRVLMVLVEAHDDGVG